MSENNFIQYPEIADLFKKRVNLNQQSKVFKKSTFNIPHQTQTLPWGSLG
jgi:hypothetical protein